MKIRKSAHISDHESESIRWHGTLAAYFTCLLALALRGVTLLGLFFFDLIYARFHGTWGERNETAASCMSSPKSTTHDTPFLHVSLSRLDLRHTHTSSRRDWKLTISF